MTPQRAHIAEPHPGLFIVLEGLDGSGTTTQSLRLAEHLRAMGIAAVVTSEPTPGPLGSVIRQAIEKRLTLDPRALAAAFAADRLDHYFNPINGIQSQLAAGSVVISDRYALSSLAYQSLDAPLEWLLMLNCQAPPPDLQVLLRVSPEVAWKRIGQRAGADELYHVPDKLRRIAENYERAAELHHPLAKCIAVDGELPANEVFAAVLGAVEPLLHKVSSKG